MSNELSPVQKLQAELESAKASIASLTSERDATKSELVKEAEKAKQLTAEKATAEKLAADAAKALEDAKAKADKDAADLSAKLQAESDSKSAAEKAKAESDAELAKLKAAVAGNPAFADAAAKGAKPVADVGPEIPKTITKAEWDKLDPKQKMNLSIHGTRIEG